MVGILKRHFVKNIGGASWSSPLFLILVFLLPEAAIYQSNKHREHAVPEDVMIKQIENFQFPLIDEAHQFYVIGKKGRLLYQSGYSHEASTLREVF